MFPVREYRGRKTGGGGMVSPSPGHQTLPGDTIKHILLLMWQICTNYKRLHIGLFIINTTLYFQPEIENVKKLTQSERMVH